MDESSKPAAVIYGRQSLGNEASIEQQLDLGRKRAETEGWQVHAVYSDRVSASRHGHAPRTDWPRLVADVQGGKVGQVWMWESSRGDRRASTWLAFLEDCRDGGVSIFVETHGRNYRMDNPRDWRNLAEDGTDSEYESEKIRQRVMRSTAARAAAGLVHGPTPYGYRRQYDVMSNGKRVLVGQVPDPDTAPIVRELFDRLAAGHSLRAIARDLEARGVRNRRGKPFAAVNLRIMAQNHAYAGIRAHSTNGIKHHRPGAQVETVPGTWEPLVPPKLFHQVQAILSNPARRTSRPGRANNSYTMITRCAVCDSPLTVRYDRDPGGDYWCRDHSHVRIPKPEFESFLDEVICGYLSRPDVYQDLQRATEPNDRLESTRTELAEARAELTELRHAVGTGRLSVASLVAAEPGLLARVSDLEDRERKMSTPPALSGLITPGADVRSRWQAAPISTRREVARILLAPDVIGTVRVQIAPTRGHRGPVGERVVFDRTDSEAIPA